MRVPPDFEIEFPSASRKATEAFLNLGMLVGAVRAAVEGLVDEAGLPSMAGFNVLSVLDGDPRPLRPSVIAERMMVTRATITGLLDSLEARGMVARHVNTADGRSRDVAITATGRRIVRRLVPRLHDFERSLMGVLNDRQLDDLLAMVAVLQRRVGDLAPGSRLGIR